MDTGSGTPSDHEGDSAAGDAGDLPGTPATVEITRDLPATVAHVWQTLTTASGARALLGSPAPLGSKGETWHGEDGTSGVVRSFHPLEQLRVSWHAEPDAPPTLVELDLTAAGAQTQITLRQDNVDPSQTGALHQRWAGALDRLSQAVTG